MYFIARNNKFYNYIAHTKPRYRYYCTAIILCSLLLIFYAAQQLIHTYSIIYSQELSALDQKNQNSHTILRQNNKLSKILTTTKRKQANKQGKQNVDDFFKQQLLFTLRAAQQSGLVINSCTALQTKDMLWYKKEITQCDFSGSLEQIISFLDTIKKSEKMISISRWSLLAHDNIYTLQATIDFVFIA